MDGVRKILFLKEQVLAEAGRSADKAVTRAAAIAVIHNPFAGAGHVDDLASLFDLGAALGEQLMPQVVGLLSGGSPTGSGKAAIVGVNGDVEHGAALLHPKLGRPMRAAVGGGEAIISSYVKGAAAGARIEVPLALTLNFWAFVYLDTLTIWPPKLFCASRGAG